MAEKRTIELEIQDNSKSLKQQYREAVQELQKLSQQYGETSDQAVKAAKAAAELKDQIEFSKDLIKGFNPDAKFAAAEGAINGVMNGIQAFEGGLALIGVESDKVQEALLRVQSVMALTQGINGLMQAKDAFATLGTVAKTALKGIKTELIATGIGAFVVALGTVVAYWDEIKEAVGGVSEEQKKLNKQIDKDIEAQEHKGKMLDNQDNILRQQGKSEKQILEYKVKQIDGEIKLAEQKLAATKVTAKSEYDAAVRNRGYAEMFFRLWLEGQALIFRAMVAPIDMVLTTANKVSEALGLGVITTSTINEEITKLTKAGANFFAGLLFDPAETKAKSDATIKEIELGIQTMKNEKAGFENQITDLGKKGAQDRSNNEKDNAKETLDLERENIDKRLALMSEGEAKEKAIAEEKAKREKEDLLASSKDKIVDAQQLADAQKLIDDNLQKDLQGITDKYDKIEKDALALKNAEQIKLQDEQWYSLQKLKNSQKEQELLDLQIAYDKEYEAAGNNALLQKELTEKFNKDSAAINKKYADAEVAAQKVKDAEIAANRKKLHDNSIQAAQDTLQTISNLTELFAGKSVKQQKKAFQIQKAVNIANAVIDTYKAANTALASSPPPFNYIAMAAAITAGLLNVKKIASQKFEGGASTGGGGGGSNAPAGAPMTANFNTIGSSGINQLAQLQQTPTQAYVVSGEVTSAQALDRNRVQNATL
jgi:hypothetical protein